MSRENPTERRTTKSYWYHVHISNHSSMSVFSPTNVFGAPTKHNIIQIIQLNQHSKLPTLRLLCFSTVLATASAGWTESAHQMAWQYERHQQDPRHRKGRYLCRNCGKIFSYNDNMVRHRRQCEGTFHLKCHVCGRQFHRRDLYASHLAVAHGIMDDKRQNST
ncbi:hypothetical protein BaRGS_00027488 [Batillaria attramentaria]|uniref:C2H2-type domain-containing protein n=1 Tax=Batillaria attramentaria TaxID=370345 RepID=A0ABD0K306_9CAEN